MASWWKLEEKVEKRMVLVYIKRDFIYEFHLYDFTSNPFTVSKMYLLCTESFMKFIEIGI